MNSIEPMNADFDSNSCKNTALPGSSETNRIKPMSSRWKRVRSIFGFEKKRKHTNVETQTDPDLFHDGSDSNTHNKEQQSDAVTELTFALKSLRKTATAQADAIKQLSSNCKVTDIRISDSSNCSIKLTDEEVEESIQCIEQTMNHLLNKSSKMEELLHRIKDNIEILDNHWQKDGASDREELQKLKSLASKIDAITSQKVQYHPSDVWSKTCDARYIDDKGDDVHCWLPRQEFRKMIHSQSEQSLAQLDLREQQTDMREMILENNTLLKELHANTITFNENVSSEVDTDDG